MNEPNEHRLDEEHLQALRGQLEALSQELAAAQPASAASGPEGAELTAEMKHFAEYALGSAGGEMVSFGVGDAPPTELAELTELHAKMICGIVASAAGLGSKFYDDYHEQPLYPQAAIDFVKHRFRPDDLPVNGQLLFFTAQMTNWCVMQMGDEERRYGALVYFLASHGPLVLGGEVWPSICSIFDDALWEGPLVIPAHQKYAEVNLRGNLASERCVLFDCLILNCFARLGMGGAVETMMASLFRDGYYGIHYRKERISAGLGEGPFWSALRGVAEIFDHTKDGKRYRELVQALYA